MNKLQRQQSGFTAIEVLLCAVVVVILGFTGYLVYHSQRNATKALNDANNTAQSTTVNETKQVTTFAECKQAAGSRTLETYPGQCVTKDGKTFVDTVAQTQGQKYLDIKEIGVKLLLNDTVADAIYAPFSNSPTDGSQVFGISTSMLVNSGGGVSCSAADGTLGVIIATTNPTVAGPNSTTELVPDGETVFKFGNIYYRYVRPQDTGCADGSMSSAQVNAAQSAFAQSFTTLQPDSSNVAPN